MPSPQILLARLGLVLALSGVLATSTASSAAGADTLQPRPASGYYLLGGAGFGHGHGMSQYGARAAASQGASATQILAQYYPGTSAVALADSQLRVELRRAGSAALVVGAASGRQISVPGRSTVTLPSQRARVVATGTSGSERVQVQLLGADGAWRAWSAPWGTSVLPAPVVISPPSGQLLQLLTPTGEVRAYRGAAQVRTNTATGVIAATSSHPGARSGMGVRSVNLVGMEHYLLGVVGREMPASWPQAALRAQAVAARSYAARARVDARGAGRGWDLCDTESCQVYGGVWVRTGPTTTQLEDQRVTDALRGSSLAIRVHEGKPIFSQFSASNGGWMAKGSQPYLVAGADPWTQNDPHLSWEARLPVSHLEARYPQLGRLTGLQVTSRDGQGRFGGRVLAVELRGSRDGTSTVVRLSGNELRSGWGWPSHSTGMRSTYWEIRPQ